MEAIACDESPTMTDEAQVTINTPVFNNGYDWHHDERITELLRDTDAPQPTAEEAEELVQERFGCVYKTLSDELRRNRRLLLIATIQSCGHELQHAPEDMRAELDSNFFIKAMEHGVSSWILQHASAAVRQNPVIANMIENEQEQKRRISDALKERMAQASRCYDRENVT